ncbi:unnamed protein product, partial [marine sediment metagenome]
MIAQITLGLYRCVLLIIVSPFIYQGNFLSKAIKR